MGVLAHGVLAVMTMGTTVHIRLRGCCWVIFPVCSLLLRLVQLVGLELDSLIMIKWYEVKHCNINLDNCIGEFEVRITRLNYFCGSR